MNWGNTLAISVAGGKGGIGKSSFTANLGCALAQAGKQVIIVDADIGAANLHTMVGVSYPTKTLADFFKNQQLRLDDVVIDSPYQNLRLISSASDILAITSPNYEMNQRFFRGIQRLNADVIIFDIAAGTHHRAIDFFALAPIGIIMVEPIPTAMENAFLFIKNLLFRYLLRLFYTDKEMKSFILEILNAPKEFKILQFDMFLKKVEERAPERIAAFKKSFAGEKYKLCLVANTLRNLEQLEVIDRFARIVKRYLGLTPQILGALPYESAMDACISQRTPFIVKYPQSGYAKGIRQIASRVLLLRPDNSNSGGSV